jgi:hypothetical protein
MKIDSGQVAGQAKVPPLTCTCHPHDAPNPCQRKHATHECWQAAVMDETRHYIAELKGRDRNSVEQMFLDYLMRVRRAYEV